MGEQQHILIAANPKSGAVSRQAMLDALRNSLIDDGFEVDLCTSLDQVQQQAAQMHSAGKLRAVISAGGDGTAAALANRITSEIPLLIFPLGTENLLAKHLGLTNVVASAQAKIREARTIALDVGLANGKMFLVMASCGFDAAVVDAMHSNRKGHINRWSYTMPILQTLQRYRFPMVDLRTVDNDSGPASVEGHVTRSALTAVQEPRDVTRSLPATFAAAALQQVAWTFIFNVPRYAANLQFCPQADPLDGKLDVCTFRRPGILNGLSYLSRLWFGSHQSLEGFSHSLATSIHLQCGTEPTTPLEIPYQLDGDPGGVLPLEIHTLPGRLKLIV